VAGFGGMEFKISPAVGLVLSELLLDGNGKTVDISRSVRNGSRRVSQSKRNRINSEVRRISRP
jgi:hypothetical protein